jgi:hypothetical protein
MKLYINISWRNLDTKIGRLLLKNYLRQIDDLLIKG